jgi:hypothetical protein
MSVARSVAEVLAERVTFELECVDRLYLNLYVPRLQRPEGVVGFFRGHRGFRFASSALMDPISKSSSPRSAGWPGDEGVPVVELAKGQRKDDVMQERLARFTGTEGCCSGEGAGEGEGVSHAAAAQPATGHWIVPAIAMPNHSPLRELEKEVRELRLEKEKESLGSRGLLRRRVSVSAKYELIDAEKDTLWMRTENASPRT